MHAYFSGFSVGLGLIVAIGAQNAFVLKQGLRREHVFAICLICAVSDAALIAFGVSGFHVLVKQVPWIVSVMRWCGAAFLIFYGARSALSAWKAESSLVVQDNTGISLLKAASICLALTWLNPHVYLDTVVLVGAISTQFAPYQSVFGLGAASASFVFFFSLGYGAALLRPVFARPAAWRILDAVIALIMWAIAFRLLMGL
ncbi:LysE/ArgO family amino acid transporter [Microvirga sp. W0021]|uniref:LysE/ArgO family amino acid transporter n=1 Tax=Hohaiivirga grylli TaxID=3133970 RepID=A0ABV0BJ64_9HYPH